MITVGWDNWVGGVSTLGDWTTIEHDVEVFISPDIGLGKDDVTDGDIKFNTLEVVDVDVTAVEVVVE